MWTFSLSVCTVCYICVIQAVPIFERDSGRQTFEPGRVSLPLETLPPIVPLESHIIEEAFSPLEIWRASDAETKKKILNSYIRELPLLTPVYNGDVPSKRQKFGFMGSRGKRTQLNSITSEQFLNSIRPGFQRALVPLTRLSPELSNSKRQPDFGFHAVRG